MNKFVFDTNIWISLLHRKRNDWIYEQSILNELYLFTCIEQLKEFQDVHQKYLKVRKLLPEPTMDYVAFIMLVCDTKNVENRYQLLVDYKDNYLVDLAHQTKSTLVTNDKGFDLLKSFKTPPIAVISIKEFYKKFDL